MSFGFVPFAARYAFVFVAVVAARCDSAGTEIAGGIIDESLS